MYVCVLTYVCLYARSHPVTGSKQRYADYIRVTQKDPHDVLRGADLVAELQESTTVKLQQCFTAVYNSVPDENPYRK